MCKLVLRTAFNLILRLNSRAATLKRLGTPDLYSPIRITSSNYFRYLEGPSATVVRGREFIIPVDSIKGSYTQLISFTGVPTTGSFTLTYGILVSAAINFDDAAADVQTALRALTGLASVTVTGDFTNGFLVTFIGVNNPTLLVATKVLLDELDEDISVVESTGAPWSIMMKRGDKILDSVFGSMAVDEMIEMPDLGGTTMGYRVRVE
tara:strand:- start:202 stop:825 length:624 start_codon:yes stop_codon:yes gene_type:complete